MMRIRVRGRSAMTRNAIVRARSIINVGGIIRVRIIRISESCCPPYS